ncbi:MAG: glycosyltransferase [Dermatophilaceae bacterium]
MRVLMLVATSVATDTRVLREAQALVGVGHSVHIIGRSVPAEYQPPDGVTVSTVGTSSVFRAEGSSSLSGRRLRPWTRLARWVLLPQHRNSAYGRWAAGAVVDARSRAFDIVHAHDFTALEAGATLATERGVPYIYDTHELWLGRPREHRPTPLQRRRERAVEGRLGTGAATVITVGEGVADTLRATYGWSHVVVVRNTFPAGKEPVASSSPVPDGLVYAGRLSAYRELETVAQASRELDLPVTLVGPADDTWLSGFDPGAAVVRAAESVDRVDELLADAGLALVTHSDRWENHRLALPNKLFHAVHAGVPVVATDVGELAKVVREYGLGTLYRPGDAADLVRAVHAAVADYAVLRRAVAAARRELSWSADGERLVAVYDRLASDRRPPRDPGSADLEERT